MIKLTEISLYYKGLYEPKSEKMYEFLFNDVEVSANNIQFIFHMYYGNKEGTSIFLNGGECFKVKETYNDVKELINQKSKDFIEYNAKDRIDKKYFVNENFIYSISYNEDFNLLRLNNISIKVDKE